jgi:DNA-binding beta-propeller fold protein YncE
MKLTRPFGLAVALLALTSSAMAQIVVSGNENKIDLVSGAARVVPDASPDSLTVIDLSVTPPRVQHVEGIPNSVIGPPTNIALTPDERLALVASSVKLDPNDPAGFVPDDVVRVVDLEADPPAVVGTVKVGRQPSGISVRGAGDLALVANRADGTVSVLAIQGTTVTARATLQVGDEGDEICDVAFTPDGRRAIATNQTRSLIHVLNVEGGEVEVTAETLTGYGGLYHGEITPDGTLALAAGGGSGWGAGAITVVDLEADPVEIIQVQTIGTGPESFTISPDGRLVAAVLMNGSNLAPDDPRLTDAGRLVLLSLRDRTLRRVQELPIGRIPEGVTFTPDGREVLVQYHPDRTIAVFSVEGERLEDSGRRIDVPGQPSAIRTVEYPLRFSRQEP